MGLFASSPLSLAAALLLAGSVIGVAGAAVPTGQTIDAIRCERAEGALFHIHQHVTILDRGKPVAIPSDVGRPLGVPCLYWLHTHDNDGIVHVESPKFRSFTLGNLFDVMGEPLSVTTVGAARVRRGALRVFVDGHAYSGDPRKIELAQHTDITIETGPPYSKPVAFTDWKGQ